MTNIWLIRPGENAFLWDDCRDNGCIAVGWENEDGYSKYKSLDDVKSDYSPNSRAARMIWSFYKEIEIGDVVIAPGGQNNVLGIGKITSDYISPNDDNNPGFEYKNVRMVDWLINEKLDNILSNLPLQTVTKNKNNERWEEIKVGYIKMNQEYKKIFDNLIQSEDIDLSYLIKQFLKEIGENELQDHIKQHDSRRKNIQDKLRNENIAALNENEMENLLKDTDAAYGIRYNLRDIFTKNDGFENFKDKLINLLETTSLNENDVNKLVNSINLMGSGFLSELLCLKYPEKFWIWNSVTDDFLSKINIDIKATLPHGKKGNTGAQYIAMQTHLQNILDLLQKHGLKDATFLDVDVFVYWMKDRTLSKTITSVPENIKYLNQTFSHTRNVILYGPPGTGKTYIAQQFIKSYLRDQISTPKTFNGITLDRIHDLKLYEVIALAIYGKDKDKKIKVTELKNDELIMGYFEIVKGRTKNIASNLWSQLGSHSTIDSKLVKHEKRSQPALFDKTPESEWYLIPEGIEYIENSLEDIATILTGDEKPDYETNIEQYYKFVTFHQSYGYEDFLEGLKPKTDDTGAISYEIEPGVFKDICDKAKNDSANKYLLIIDEINRGNIAKIFGELITLIEDDKRQGAKNEMTVTLPYSKEDFTVPLNLSILGTMNTADRSIALLDIALRRRFTFLEIMPDYSIIDCEIEGLNPGALLKELNCMVASLIDRDHQIGHSYFCGIVKKIKNEELESAKTELQFVWYRKIIPLLQEYFYNDWEQLKLVLGDFVSENNTSNNNAKLQDRMVNKNYSITEFEDWGGFSNALGHIASNEVKTETQVDATESESVEEENES